MTSAHLTTIPELFQATIARVADQPALGLINGEHVAWITWSELDVIVRQFASRLRREGIKQGDRVAQWAPNGLGWIATDLALLSLGAVHVPLHASHSIAQVSEFLRLADTNLLVVAGDEELAESAVSPTRIFRHFVLADKLSEWCENPVPWSQLEETNVTSDQLATLIFTSGTSGHPRGVMLSHGNLVSNALAVGEAVGSDANETRLCFLPLSHIYARTCDLYSWVSRGSKLVLVESRDTIVRDCQLSKPTVINGVPYFYQKIAQQMGDAAPRALQNHFGGELKRCFCGGAAVAPEVERLFEQQGLPILSGYGLTETSPVISATKHADYRSGTVGKPLPNVEVRLAKGGEILVRGSSVMLGYWNDQAATDEAIVDGWLHTGDLGEFDEAGHLRIIGRKKEVIVLSTGKNVSPSRVEQLLSGTPLVEHVCVVGEGRKCLGALIVPNPDALRQEIRNRRLWVWSRRRAVTHPQVRALFRQEIDRLLQAASTEEQVGYFSILPRNFSTEQGELTTKLSLCRAVIADRFAREIEQMYAS